MKKNSNMKKFVQTAYHKISSPKGLTLALITTFIMGMGVQKVITDMKDNNKREKVKAEIEKYLSTQPNYDDTIAIVSEFYDKEITELTEKLDKINKEAVFYTDFDANERMKGAWDHLSKAQRNKVVKTLREFEPALLDSETPFKQIMYYYYLYDNRIIDRDQITDIYEKYNSTVTDFYMEKFYGPKNKKTNLYDIDNGEGLYKKSRKAETKLDSLKNTKAETVEKFQKAKKSLDFETKKHIDSLYVKNKIKQQKVQ